MMHYQSLKLDSTFRPIEVVDARDALVMVLLGKAVIVETYDKFIRTPTTEYLLPAVIVLKRYLKYRPFEVVYNRRNILLRDNYTCQYCDCKFPSDQLTLDHVTPKSRGGKTTWLNITTACKKCNQRKGSKTPFEANMFPTNKPIKPKFSLFNNYKCKTINNKWIPYVKGR
mgnify:FL=1